jgi:hypothetical protein
MESDVFTTTGADSFSICGSFETDMSVPGPQDCKRSRKPEMKNGNSKFFIRSALIIITGSVGIRKELHKREPEMLLPVTPTVPFVNFTK